MSLGLLTRAVFLTLRTRQSAERPGFALLLLLLCVDIYSYLSIYKQSRIVSATDVAGPGGAWTLYAHNSTYLHSRILILAV